MTTRCILEIHAELKGVFPRSSHNRVKVLVVSVVFAALAGTTVLAGDDNRVHGCVTTSTGASIPDARVIVAPLDRLGQEKATKTSKSGCYEFRDLRFGRYEVRLEDESYVEKAGPVQETVNLVYHTTVEVNLVKPYPSESRLKDGIVKALGAAAGGFVALRQKPLSQNYQDFTNEVIAHIGLNWGPGSYAASVVPGFRACGMIAMAGDLSNGEHLRGATYKCKWSAVRRQADAEQIFETVSRVTTEATQSIRANSFRSTSCSGSDQIFGGCMKEVDWLGGTNQFAEPHVSLELYRGKDNFTIFLTFSGTEVDR